MASIINLMYVYIIRSLESGRIYIGLSQDPNVRLEQHNRGENKSTKAYRPWLLLRTEKYKNRALAFKREKFLKSGTGRRVVKNLVNR